MSDLANSEIDLPYANSLPMRAVKYRSKMIMTGDIPKFDVLVIGSGAAGLVAGQEAAKDGLSVLVVSKGQIGRSGATATITGDISVDGETIHRLGLSRKNADSTTIFFEDTMKGGGYLNDRRLVESMISGVGSELEPLLKAGLKVAGIGHAPGHSFPRGVLISGMQLLQLLSKKAAAAGVKYRDELYVTDVLVDRGRAVGIFGYDMRSGAKRTIAANAVIIAAGGGGMVHPFRTVPEELVGDGYHLALQAGASLIDMEMIQFLPCCLVNPPLWRGIQFPWIIGPQSGTRAWLLNRYGERFMARYDLERMEMSTRDLISRACVREVQEGRGGPGGGVFMSWSHLPQDILDFLPQWYGKPLLRSNWIWEGFDFKELVARIKQGYAVEVAPAAHFMMGGVDIDDTCQTSVTGLFACGEVAGGVHGANRLSGNACTQFLVQGRAAGRAASRSVKCDSPAINPKTMREFSASDSDASVRQSLPRSLLESVQSIANAGLNVVRSSESLAQALKAIQPIAQEARTCCQRLSYESPYNRNVIDALEARSAAVTVEAMTISALKRQESRGAHFREDFPDSDDKFLRHGIVTAQGDELNYSLRNMIG
jgi:succinate dehydrogenase/fumarate reductase flavoprotein subunit